MRRLVTGAARFFPAWTKDTHNRGFCETARQIYDGMSAGKCADHRERKQLGIMSVRNTVSSGWRQFAACLRLVRVALHLAYGVLLAGLLPILNKKHRQDLLQNWSANLLCILNIRVEPVRPGNLNRHGALIVCNHVSWLDIFILNSVCPTRFVAKAEVRNWPLIGWLSRQAQTIFIRREKRSDTIRANHLAARGLRQSDHVAIFPEGTTTDGRQVRHFHSSLFQCAIEAGAAVCPAAIHYRDVHGKTAEAAAYIGDMTFVESLWNILRCRSLSARISFLPELPVMQKNRRELAVKAHHCIAGELRRLLDDAGTAQSCGQAQDQCFHFSPPMTDTDQ